MVDRDWIEESRALHRRLRDRPLDYARAEDRALYQPVHDERHDPVERLLHTIEIGVEQSVQLVAGFRGVGKTTEFSRLESMLWERGYLVARIDLDEHLDLNTPVDVRDFLLLFAGALSESLLDDRMLDQETALALNFWRQARGFLEGAQDAELAIRDASGEINWRVSIKESREFREHVRHTLGSKLPHLEREVHGFVAAVIAALRARHGDDRKLVVIVDSLEHIRGPIDAAASVHASVRELFITHGKRFEFADMHLVFSVPAFMALHTDHVASVYVNGAVQAWAAFHLWSRSRGDLVVDEETLGRLVRLVERRIDWRKILRDESALREIIMASGGYARDLLNLLIEALFQARRDAAADPEQVIARVRRNYLPIFANEAELLRRIAETRDLKALDSSHRERVAAFLDAHLLLCYLNDDFWYDVHPLVKRELGV